MPKFLVHGNYIGEGIAGLLKEGGTSRRAAVETLVASVGGKVEALYYAFGDTDVYVLVDMPDNAAATALALKVNASGRVAIRTTPLMTPEDVDEAVKRTPDYRPPGR